MSSVVAPTMLTVTLVPMSPTMVPVVPQMIMPAHVVVSVVARHMPVQSRTQTVLVRPNAHAARWYGQQDNRKQRRRENLRFLRFHLTSPRLCETPLRSLYDEL